MDVKVRELAESWGFQPEVELPSGYCSRVFADETRVLKVPFQGEELTSGCVAVVRMSGTVGPKVHAWDEATGVILMDRLLPGTSLSQAGLSDEECLNITVEFAHRIRENPVDALEWELTDQAGSLHHNESGHCGQCPSSGSGKQGCLHHNRLMPLRNYVDADDPLGQELLQSTTEEVFLHGDLHHSNILLGPEGWVVIDPKGLIGDPAFEPSAFIRNPIEEIGEWEDLPLILERRIRRFAKELQLDPWRVWGWSLVVVRDGGTEPGHAWDKVRLALEEVGQLFSHR
ncbi:MAG: hypothetical protein KF784_00755 [Fimbriimonadaceae bacterium]|nr:hypothetical protein [Fimbriimonadaceae bacterium]